MSEKDDKNIEQVAEEAQSTELDADNTESSAAVPEPPSAVAAAPAQAEQPAAAPVRKSSSAVGWLALLLVVVLAGGALWYVQDLLRRETALVQRLTELEAVAAQKETNLERLSQRWQQQLQQGMGEMQAEAAQQVQSVQGFEQQLTTLRTELARFSAHDRDSWLLAEAEYLLRLANQRLIMAGDTVAAQALLASADAVLRELDDVSLHPVRAAVASDLAAVRAVPEVDVEGIYLRLSALAEQAGNLVIFEFPEREDQPRGTAAEDWQARLQQGYAEALVKLSDYVIIRRRDVPMQALMDPQWEGLVRQNLRMLMEQAQHWVAQFFESDAASARAMEREIKQLADLQVQVTLPDISRSLDSLDDVIERRLQQSGEE